MTDACTSIMGNMKLFRLDEVSPHEETNAVMLN